MKHIINFYTKGKAPKLLGGFYEACAQVEIDEYQNYDKALGALTEAYRCLEKAGDQMRLDELKDNMKNIKEFVDIQAQYENSAAAAIDRCKDFLNSGSFIMVRRGDVYGFMIEHFAKNNQFKPAYTMIEDMKTKIPNVNVAYYINLQTIRAVEQALNVQIIGGGGDLEQDDDEDEIVDETDRYN